MALVLSGGYEEAGDRGSVRVRAGDLVMHGAYEAHLNRYDAEGAEELNLALPWQFEPHTTVMRLADPRDYETRSVHTNQDTYEHARSDAARTPFPHPELEKKTESNLMPDAAKH